MPEIPLVWNAKNVEHIAKHGVDAKEVEEAVGDRKASARKQKGRYALIGSAWGRILFIILEKVNAGYYVVTARDAEDKEKKRYKMK